MRGKYAQCAEMQKIYWKMRQIGAGFPRFLFCKGPAGAGCPPTAELSGGTPPSGESQGGGTWGDQWWRGDTDCDEGNAVKNPKKT